MLITESNPSEVTVPPFYLGASEHLRVSDKLLTYTGIYVTSLLDRFVPDPLTLLGFHEFGKTVKVCFSDSKS
jgi:hypothetical protein